MTLAKSKQKRVAEARAVGEGAGYAKASAPTASVNLQLHDDYDFAVSRIARSLRAKRPDLSEDFSQEASASLLASSFIAYAAEQGSADKSVAQWCKVLAEVLGDAQVVLDEEENEVAISAVVADLSKKGVLTVPQRQIEVGDLVMAVLTEDDSWHEAFVDQNLAEGMHRVIFLEYGKPQDTATQNIRRQDDIELDDADGELREGDCELCQRHLKLTFHHLIPKDTHPTYLGKPGQLASIGIEGEPSRGFLNTYGTMVCGQCHSNIHRLAPNHVLAKEYNTLPKIKEHPKIQRWMEWASTQAPAGRLHLKKCGSQQS